MTRDPNTLGPTLPPYAGDTSPLARMFHEIWDHLWPWSRRGFRRQRFIQALGVAAAVVVTVAWLLAATGRIGGGAIIAWWVGWSVFEVLIRLQSKPYVKEGPWWGRNYRTASWMDMVCYVSFKNLLVGIVLFVGLRAAGVLDFLQGLPGLKWLY